VGNIKLGSNKQDFGSAGLGGPSTEGTGMFLKTGCEDINGRTESFLGL
jgi:hypothetical protein